MAIRAARRGALSAAILFGILVVVATVVAAPVLGMNPEQALVDGIVVAVFSLPALALLGAGLTSAALGTPMSAVSAGLAMGVGVPVAAVTSAIIGAFLVVGVYDDAGRGADVAGILLRAGVTAAVRISPLIALASAAWVLLVRRVGRPAVRPARAPRRPPG